MRFNFNASALYLSLILTGCGSNADSSSTPAPLPPSNNGYQWVNQSHSIPLPTGVEYFSTMVDGVALYYLDLDLTNTNLALRAVKAEKSQTIEHYVSTEGVIAAVNGGFFGGDTPYSAVVDEFTYYAKNITSLNRNGSARPVLRSALTLNRDNKASIDWIYQFDNSGDVYTYEAPIPYQVNDPVAHPTPIKEDGTQIDARLAMGGGPRLLKDGERHVSYNEEIFWGSGVELDDYRPRTATCLTADQHLLLFVATNYQLNTLPDILLSLGCVEAMNLDGGGSTAMALVDNVVYDQGRAVPTALLIVDKSRYGQ